MTLGSGLMTRVRHYDSSTMRTILGSLLLLVLTGSQAAGPALPAPGGALGELDQAFLDAYQAAQSAVKLSHPPVVLMLGSNLALRLSGKPEVRERVIPDSYQAMKAVAHGPFAAYLILNRTAGARIDQP